MKSKTKISKQLVKKSNPELVETIILAKKNKAWLDVAAILSGSRRNSISVNLQDLNDQTEKEKILAIPGKVLSVGEIDKKIKIVALNFSSMAKEKLKKSGCETMSIIDEIKKNPEAKGVKIIK
jgi:large subunit ribosomal protein L18e